MALAIIAASFFMVTHSSEESKISQEYGNEGFSIKVSINQPFNLILTPYSKSAKEQRKELYAKYA